MLERVPSLAEEDEEEFDREENVYQNNEEKTLYTTLFDYSSDIEGGISFKTDETVQVMLQLIYQCLAESRLGNSSLPFWHSVIIQQNLFLNSKRFWIKSLCTSVLIRIKLIRVIKTKIKTIENKQFLNHFLSFRY